MTQKRLLTLHVPLFLVVATAAAVTVAASKPVALQMASPKAEASLVGTWKMIKGSFNGKEFVPRTTILKLHTPTHYVFVDYDSDGKIVDFVGGTYMLTGGRYETKPMYGAGPAFNSVKGKAQSFECKLEGTRWYHKGTLSSGLTIDEIWERID
jgi:hypothetical protein